MRQKLIAAAATEILTTARPDNNFPPLGEHWAARWLDVKTATEVGVRAIQDHKVIEWNCYGTKVKSIFN